MGCWHAPDRPVYPSPNVVMSTIFEIGTAGAQPRYIRVLQSSGDSPDPMASNNASYINCMTQGTKKLGGISRK